MSPAMEQTETPTKLCANCAAQMPANAAYCPGCGRPMPSTAPAQGNAGAAAENFAGAAAYLTFVPAMVFLFVEPYRRSRFVRFHSLQCILLWGAAILLAVVLKVLGMLLFIVPVLGPLLVLIVDVLAGLATLFLWLVLIVKALQGETFKLPWLGDLAEHHARTAQEGSSS